MFIKQISRAATVGIILTLATACVLSPDNDAPTADHTDEKPVIILGKDSNGPFTAEVLERLRQTREATADNPGQPDGTRTKGNRTHQRTSSEDRRWCQAWALDHMPAHMYAEFRALDPDNMDDIDRATWRKRFLDTNPYHYAITLHLPGGDPEQLNVCWMYWAEPISSNNADRRNNQYEAECLKHLVTRADRRWDQLRDSPHAAAYDIPNQYIRILQWLHTPGSELLASQPAPWQTLLRLAADADTHAYDEDHYSMRENVPTHRELVTLNGQYGADAADYFGLLIASSPGSGDTYHTCHNLAPQIYSGFWIPILDAHAEPSRPMHPDLARTVDRLTAGPILLPAHAP